MKAKRSRYQKFRKAMKVILLSNAGMLVLYLLAARLDVQWLKTAAAILTAVPACLSLVYLYITQELFKRRSRWMVFGAGAILLCLLGALLLNLPGNGAGNPGGTSANKPVDADHVHAYTKTVQEPSCLEKGYSLFRCDCGDEYTGEQTAALGHNPQDTLVGATAEAPGYTTHTCSRCGMTWKDTFTWLAETPTDFFDDAVFIGDSITLGLRNFNYEKNWLGKATILCQGSYSVAHAVENTMYLSFRGEDMSPQQALAACGAKKVFILLGMNDIALHGVDKSLENWGKLVANIRGTCPDMAIYIQSGTPIYTPGQKGGLNNERMDAYNERLKAFAEENDCIYLDVATAMKDDTNGLAANYTSDAYVHLTEAACELWVEQLKNYVGQ